MKVAVFLAVIVITATAYTTTPSALKVKWQNTIDSAKAKVDGIKTDVGELAGGVKEVAVHKAKALGGELLSAVAGAFVNSFKGFNLGEILFGKREVDLDELFNILQALEEAHDRETRGVLSDKFKAIGESAKTTFNGIKDDMVDLGGGLKEVAVHKAKSLLGETISAVAGAFINSFKDFSLGKILFGKREVSSFHNLDAFILALIRNTTESLDNAFGRTFSRFEKVVESLVQLRPSADVQQHLKDVTAAHHLAVRGIIGDALNTGIDFIKSVWYKAKDGLGRVKDKLFGGNPSVISDPIMVGRRNVLTDAWSKLTKKFNAIKEEVKNRYQHASEIVDSVSGSLGYYAGKMLEQGKKELKQKAQETLQDLTTTLKGHLTTAKDTLATFKQEVYESLQKAIQV